jgi:transcriptional regulator with XRE-family HTH domain
MGAREDKRRRLQRTRQVRSAIGAEFRQLRSDAGLTARAVAVAAGISPSHLSGIELGKKEASTEVLVAVADVLGADLTIKAFPGTGPRIHDHIQARIVEELVRVSKGRWRAFVEVPVYRPARGYVDVVLAERSVPRLVSTEVHSDLGRLEQQLRWAQDKAASLASSELWRQVDGEPETSSLLVLRSTQRTRALAQRFPEILASLYPARAADVLRAVTSDGAWPGPGLLWARVDGEQVTFLSRPPRGVTVGR